MIGQVHVESSKLQLPKGLEQKHTNALIEMLEPLVVEPEEDDSEYLYKIKNWAPQLVSRSLDVAKQMVRSTAPYKLLWCPDDNDLSQPTTYDGEWMQKSDNNMNDEPGVKFVMCPALAANHYPDSKKDHPRQIVYKAWVVADRSIPW